MSIYSYICGDFSVMSIPFQNIDMARRLVVCDLNYTLAFYGNRFHSLSSSAHFQTKVHMGTCQVAQCRLAIFVIK